MCVPHLPTNTLFLAVVRVRASTLSPPFLVRFNLKRQHFLLSGCFPACLVCFWQCHAMRVFRSCSARRSGPTATGAPRQYGW